MCLLRELRRHGVGHQRRGVLLWSLWLGEGEGGVGRTVLDATLEVVLTSEGAGLVVEAGLSVTVVAAAAEAVAVGVAPPIASVLCVCAKSFVWSVVKPSVVIPVSKTAIIAPPSRIPIPTVIPVVTTAPAP